MLAVRVLFRLILLLVFVVKQGICEQYGIGFSDGLKSCKGYDNKLLDGTKMQLGKSENGDDTCYLQGCIGISQAIESGYMMDFELSKETELGNEPVWSSSLDVCKCIDDDNAPWTAALKQMKISSCPVETGEYTCEHFSLNMSSMNEVLDDKWRGNYQMTMMVKNKQMDVLSCHMLGLAIEPVDE